MSSINSSANEKLVENLETQLERLVSQLNDLEGFKDELAEDELNEIREETVEQIKEFKDTLDRIKLKGDSTLDSKVSQLRLEIRKAISNAFNTNEMIKMFGEYDIAELLINLAKVNEDLKLKKVSIEDGENEKIQILKKLKNLGHTLTSDDTQFLLNKQQKHLQAVNDEED